MKIAKTKALAIYWSFLHPDCVHTVNLPARLINPIHIFFNKESFRELVLEAHRPGKSFEHGTRSAELFMLLRMAFTT